MSRSCTIAVRLKPGAKREKIEAGEGSNITAWVTSPPVEGKANRALIELLSDTLDIPKSYLSIIKGHASRSKVVAVEGLAQGEVVRRLGRSCGAQ
jgi:uncharacterized protein